MLLVYHSSSGDEYPLCRGFGVKSMGIIIPASTVQVRKGHKRCTQCSKVKSHSLFPSNTKTKSGIGSWCKDCMTYKARLAFYARRRFVMRAKAVPCADCGVQYHFSAMQFDHVEGEKTFEIGTKYSSVSLSALKAELAKCDVVCANCHSVRTYSRTHRRSWNPRAMGSTLLVSG